MNDTVADWIGPEWAVLVADEWRQNRPYNKKEEQPMFIIRQHNAVSTRRGFNEALRLALTLRELGWACAILNMEGQVICE